MQAIHSHGGRLASWRSGHTVETRIGFHHLLRKAASMSDRESPVAVIIRTTGSLASPPPTTISNKLMTTPVISSALRATTVTQTPVRDTRRTMVDGRERSRAEPFAVMPSPCKPWTPASSVSRMQPSAVCHVLNRGRRLSGYSHTTEAAPNQGLLVQDDAHERIVDLEVAVVFDEPEFAELVHEEIDA
jgi:hypothetical protein